MVIPKPERKQDLELLRFVASQPCLVCESIPSDPHHVTTVKAGGGDTLDNVMPLCRAHHTAWHAVGPGLFVQKFRTVREWLERYGRTDVLDRIARVESPPWRPPSFRTQPELQRSFRGFPSSGRERAFKDD